MHPEVLTQNQISLLPVIHREFAKEYYLAGGTAIALQIGHRRSIDFDLFTNQDIKRNSIKRAFDSGPYQVQKVLYSAYDQLHLIVNDVKMTFFSYPYSIDAPIQFQGKINMPMLIDLAAMKAFALGGRGKWKDYVDLYFLLKNHFNINEIEQRTKAIFGEFFNRKLFREQLAYYEDIDYSEAVDFVGKEIPESEIKDFLTKVAITPI
ncbi:MAG: nucleotidyl transferase AbiEii/AbiGii toxin family protein [Candidatus Cloacimonadia bacterium]